MPRGDKSKYTDKQVRKADHIAESYEARGVPEGEAEAEACFRTALALTPDDSDACNNLGRTLAGSVAQLNRKSIVGAP